MIAKKTIQELNMEKQRLMQQKEKLKKQKEDLKKQKENLMILQNSLDDIRKMVTSKELFCACCLYKFIKDDNHEAYRKFLEMLSTFSRQEAIKMYAYYHSFPKDNSLGKNEEKKLKKGFDKYE